MSDRSCDMLQGYLFSKPLPAEEFAALLRSNKKLLVD
jgi:EAL domain-containing protein (putative c-di-GMP-specific phosphodiesterase class I)